MTTQQSDFLWRPILDEERAAWAAVAASLTEQHFAPLAAELDRDQRYPHESIPRMVEAGLTGLLIPKEYGGQGGSLTAGSAVAEAIAYGCPSTCTVWMSYAV